MSQCKQISCVLKLFLYGWDNIIDEERRKKEKGSIKLIARVFPSSCPPFVFSSFSPSAPSILTEIGALGKRGEKS